MRGQGLRQRQGRRGASGRRRRRSASAWCGDAPGSARQRQVGVRPLTAIVAGGHFGVTSGAHVEFAQVRNVASAVAVNSEREQQAVDHRVDTEQKARR